MHSPHTCFAAQDACRRYTNAWCSDLDAWSQVLIICCHLVTHRAPCLVAQVLRQRMVHLSVEAYEVAIIKPLEELLLGQQHGGGGSGKGGVARRWASGSCL